MKYMVGEQFFKENSNQGNQQILEDADSEDDTEEMPYTVLEKYDVSIIFALHSQQLS